MQNTATRSTFITTTRLWVNLFIAFRTQLAREGAVAQTGDSLPECGHGKPRLSKPGGRSLLPCVCAIRHGRRRVSTFRSTVGQQTRQCQTRQLRRDSTDMENRRSRRDEDSDVAQARDHCLTTPNRVAVLYGPTVLAGELGPEDEAGVAGLILVPALITEDRPLAEWIKPVAGEPLTFRTVGVGRPRDVTLSPFYRMHHKRYAVYWDLFTPQQWVAREADYKAELERVRRLEAMTVDFAQPGEMQPERDHNMQGERTDDGRTFGSQVATRARWRLGFVRSESAA